MNIELTAQTTKLIHLSVMDLCSIWSYLLCSRNSGLVFWLCHGSIVRIWAHHFNQLCLCSLLPHCCLSLTTDVQRGWLRTGLVSAMSRKCYVASQFLEKPLYATSEVNNYNLSIHSHSNPTGIPWCVFTVITVLPVPYHIIHIQPIARLQ